MLYVTSLKPYVTLPLTLRIPIVLNITLSIIDISRIEMLFLSNVDKEGIMTNGNYKKLFIQAAEGFLNEEKNKRLANALFLSFKCLTELAKYVLSEKYDVKFGGKSSHQEIKLFYITKGRQETANLLEGSYVTYVGAYEENQTNEKLKVIKNGIKELAKLEGVEEEFKEILDKV